MIGMWEGTSHPLVVSYLTKQFAEQLIRWVQIPFESDAKSIQDQLPALKNLKRLHQSQGIELVVPTGRSENSNLYSQLLHALWLSQQNQNLGLDKAAIQAWKTVHETGKTFRFMDAAILDTAVLSEWATQNLGFLIPGLFSEWLMTDPSTLRSYLETLFHNPELELSPQLLFWINETIYTYTSGQLDTLNTTSAQNQIVLQAEWHPESWNTKATDIQHLFLKQWNSLKTWIGHQPLETILQLTGVLQLLHQYAPHDSLAKTISQCRLSKSERDEAFHKTDLLQLTDRSNHLHIRLKSKLALHTKRQAFLEWKAALDAFSYQKSEQQEAWLLINDTLFFDCLTLLQPSEISDIQHTLTRIWGKIPHWDPAHKPSKPEWSSHKSLLQGYLTATLPDITAVIDEKAPSNSIDSETETSQLPSLSSQDEAFAKTIPHQLETSIWSDYPVFNSDTLTPILSFWDQNPEHFQAFCKNNPISKLKLDLIWETVSTHFETYPQLANTAATLGLGKSGWDASYKSAIEVVLKGSEQRLWPQTLKAQSQYLTPEFCMAWITQYPLAYLKPLLTQLQAKASKAWPTREWWQTFLEQIQAAAYTSVMAEAEALCLDILEPRLDDAIHTVSTDSTAILTKPAALKKEHVFSSVPTGPDLHAHTHFFETKLAPLLEITPTQKALTFQIADAIPVSIGQLSPTDSDTLVSWLLSLVFEHHLGPLATESINHYFQTRPLSDFPVPIGATLALQSHEGFTQTVWQHLLFTPTPWLDRRWSPLFVTYALKNQHIAPEAFEKWAPYLSPFEYIIAISVTDPTPYLETLLTLLGPGLGNKESIAIGQLFLALEQAPKGKNLDTFKTKMVQSYPYLNQKIVENAHVHRGFLSDGETLNDWKNLSKLLTLIKSKTNTSDVDDFLKTVLKETPEKGGFFLGPIMVLFPKTTDHLLDSFAVRQWLAEDLFSLHTDTPTLQDGLCIPLLTQPDFQKPLHKLLHSLKSEYLSKIPPLTMGHLMVSHPELMAHGATLSLLFGLVAAQSLLIPPFTFNTLPTRTQKECLLFAFENGKEALKWRMIEWINTLELKPAQRLLTEIDQTNPATAKAFLSQFIWHPLSKWATETHLSGWLGCLSCFQDNKAGVYFELWQLTSVSHEWLTKACLTHIQDTDALLNVLQQTPSAWQWVSDSQWVRLMTHLSDQQDDQTIVAELLREESALRDHLVFNPTIAAALWSLPLTETLTQALANLIRTWDHHTTIAFLSHFLPHAYQTTTYETWKIRHQQTTHFTLNVDTTLHNNLQLELTELCPELAAHALFPSLITALSHTHPYYTHLEELTPALRMIFNPSPQYAEYWAVHHKLSQNPGLNQMVLGHLIHTPDTFDLDGMMTLWAYETPSLADTLVTNAKSTERTLFRKKTVDALLNTTLSTQPQLEKWISIANALWETLTHTERKTIIAYLKNQFDTTPTYNLVSILNTPIFEINQAFEVVISLVKNTAYCAAVFHTKSGQDDALLMLWPEIAEPILDSSPLAQQLSVMCDTFLGYPDLFIQLILTQNNYTKPFLWNYIQAVLSSKEMQTVLAEALSLDTAAPALETAILLDNRPHFQKWVTATLETTPELAQKWVSRLVRNATQDQMIDLLNLCISESRYVLLDRFISEISNTNTHQMAAIAFLNNHEKGPLSHLFNSTYQANTKANLIKILLTTIQEKDTPTLLANLLGFITEEGKDYRIAILDLFKQIWFRFPIAAGTFSLKHPHLDSLLDIPIQEWVEARNRLIDAAEQSDSASQLWDKIAFNASVSMNSLIMAACTLTQDIPDILKVLTYRIQHQLLPPVLKLLPTPQPSISFYGQSLLWHWAHHAPALARVKPNNTDTVGDLWHTISENPEALLMSLKKHRVLDHYGAPVGKGSAESELNSAFPTPQDKASFYMSCLTPGSVAHRRSQQHRSILQQDTQTFFTALTTALAPYFKKRLTTITEQQFFLKESVELGIIQSEIAKTMAHDWVQLETQLNDQDIKPIISSEGLMAAYGCLIENSELENLEWADHLAKPVQKTIDVMTDLLHLTNPTTPEWATIFESLFATISDKKWKIISHMAGLTIPDTQMSISELILAAMATRLPETSTPWTAEGLAHFASTLKTTREIRQAQLKKALGQLRFTLSHNPQGANKALADVLAL